MNRACLFALPLALASIVACAAPASEEEVSSESDLTAAEAGTPSTDGGASSEASTATYPGDYPCDPLANIGCPEGEACALSYDKTTGVEKVACKSTAGDFCGRIFGWDKSHIIMDGRFVGMTCLAPGFPMAACRPQTAEQDGVRCPLPSQFCVPSANGTYGYCERHL